MKSHIVLLTDFGTADLFTGVLKGVIASIEPNASTIDLTHEIPPGDVLYAAVILWQAYQYFPKGTIFLCVVDPGVGTSRKPLIVQSGGYTFIGPDNGLFSFVIQAKFQAREINKPSLMLPNPGNTFHGRDIFAPTAAYIASGMPIQEFGLEIANPTGLERPTLELPNTTTLIGEILYHDRFGNLLTSLGCFQKITSQILLFDPWLPVPGIIRMQIYNNRASLILPDNLSLPMVDTFSQIEPGQCACLVGSSGLLEIAANSQSAFELLGLNRGEKITLITHETSSEQHVID